MEISILNYTQQKKPVHLVGIGGVSMNSLGELLLSLGVPVSGSDRNRSLVTERLTNLGARITYDHLAENVEGAALVIRTAAVHDDNPEIMRARALGIPVMERAEAWGDLMGEYRNVICLSGTHGKTTTTSMMTLITMHAKLDPTVMVGSNLPAIGGTLRIGCKECFVAESCEYCNSFLHFKPTVAVVLNVEEDHLDFFRDIDDIVHSFHQFCALTPEDGLLVTNADDPHAMEAVLGLDRKILTFGVEQTADVMPHNITIQNGYYSFDVHVNSIFYTHIDLQVPGYHNMLNALACCAVSFHLGMPSHAVAQGLAAFTGSSRRFQRTGEMPCGALVVDDYAHHPSEMRATLNAAKQMDFKRILCAFQPHTYTRTLALFDEFVEALSLCDVAILAPIYAARETNQSGISSADLAAKVQGAHSFDNFDDIVAFLQQEARAGDLILTMGAGNIDNIGEKLIAKPC